MPLPFKDNHSPSLPNNKRLATVRLQHLKKRLKADKEYHEHYTAFMNDIVNSGDAELAPLVSESETVWYIPHHGVYHPKKPTKLRVVFDASAKFLGISLNDTLLTGPDMTNSLVGVLCRFRREAVEIICDIQKMFHQFFVSPEMRNYLRFLWWENGQLDTDPKEYRMAVHLFGAGSSPGCANFGLKYLAQQHRLDYPKASAFVEKNFYVDDGLTSVPSVSEAKELITESQKLCKLAGLRLHKFNSSHTDALSHLAPSERANATKPLNLKPDTNSSDHVLGIQWSVENDTFSFNTSTKEQPPTRRSILSVISSLFDPLGFVAPFTLSGKSILQDLCRRGIDWDDPIPENMRTRWEEWKRGLQSLNSVSVPRCYHPSDFDNIVRVELHHFSDASNVGYGACSYLRYKNDKDQVHCSLVIAKARVAPTKVTSIPRLELSAAVTSAKLSVMLKSELEMHIDEEHFWTDSQVVLAYINNEARRFHVFVSNRVQLIRETTDPRQWHYVSTAQNPADHASRGLSASEISSTNWLSGPKFLWEPQILFPSNVTAELLVGDPEVKTVRTLATHADRKSDILSRFTKFSSRSTLLKVIARIKRLKSNAKQHPNLITVEERKEAADTIIRLVQQQAFSHELEKLKVGENLPRTSPLFSLDPILDQGLLRVGGRLKKSTLNQSMKHPIILPKDHHITKLIMTHFHSNICHQGRSQTMMELRANGFWVIGGSKEVAKLISKCVQCRKLRRPTEEQRMSELPKERVEISEPFMHCGMDCFGPFITKQGRKEHKRYGLVFTCFASRAVHIEMLEDMSTDTFINALRCFISLRGAVSKLYCDQGTNFVGAKNELKEALKQCDTNALEAFLADKQCEFVFNAPSASHAGGVWERQIRTIRNVLNATISQCSGRLDDASLRTLFYEAMSIINGRPLSVDGINDPKSPEPLTPNHLILMKSKVALPPPGKFVKEDVYARKRWRRVQYLTEQFWSRWKKEYLLNISTRQKWHVPRRNVKVNDIVIIKDEMLQRSQWQLGRVVEAPEEDDGSAFNTILPALLQDKLSQLNVPDSTCRWITDFLTDLRQTVRLGKNVSTTRTISTGSPQGCVLSPLLFSLYTNGTSSHDSVKLIKLKDWVGISGSALKWIKSYLEDRKYFVEIGNCVSDHMALTCGVPQGSILGPLLFNLYMLPLGTGLLLVPRVRTKHGESAFQFYAAKIWNSLPDDDLNWEPSISYLIKKAQQRMYFLRQLKKAKLMVQFYTAIIESILTSSITVWYAGATVRGRHRLQRIVCSAEKVIGCSLPSLQDPYVSRTLGRAGRIAADPSYPGHRLFEPLPRTGGYGPSGPEPHATRTVSFPSAVGLYTL
ncbi:hypothetical protein WMY93_004215 [Mugilogobius chulae]|uniref:Integrase catalytic domain-containing protein n=1 Tax=Mugilogobius chulae TaxID=88201 RepID=A0AAW0PWD6_9GOBI